MLSLENLPESLLSAGPVSKKAHLSQSNGRDYHEKNNSAKKDARPAVPYTITFRHEPSFPVKWEELMGWFLIPRLGEKLDWGVYDMPSRRCRYICHMQVTGKAMVHGIEGVEPTAREQSLLPKEKPLHRTFVAQLTDIHCR